MGVECLASLRHRCKAVLRDVLLRLGWEECCSLSKKWYLEYCADHLQIIESTLREGEQFANAFFTLETKIKIARA